MNPDVLTDSRTQLVLRFLKHRWLRDVGDLVSESAGQDTLVFDDVDLDSDMDELTRAAGSGSLSRLADTLLALRAPLPDDSPAISALAPEMEAPQARAFLQLLAGNLAFRLRTPEVLTALVSWVAEGPTPTMRPDTLGGLLARARSSREALALIADSGLDADDKQAASEAAAPPPPELMTGSWMHVHGDHAALEKALKRALHPLQPGRWVLAPDGTRRFLALRPRGGFVTVLEQDDALPAELAKTLAGVGGVGRVAWAAFDEGRPTGLMILDRTRTVLDLDGLREKIGADPDADDVLGALRGEGILDLDRGHARGFTPLMFDAHVGASGLAGLRRRRVTAFAYSPPI